MNAADSYACEMCIDASAGIAQGIQRAEGHPSIGQWMAPLVEATGTRHVLGPLVVGVSFRYERVLYTGYSYSGFSHTVEPTSNMFQLVAFAGLAFNRSGRFEHGPRLGLGLVRFFGETGKDAQVGSDLWTVPTFDVRYTATARLSPEWGITLGLGAWLGPDPFRHEQFVMLGVRRTIY